MATTLTETIIENFKNLTRYREKKKLTRAKLAKLTGIPHGRIIRYEFGEITPRVESYNKLAGVFGWEIVDPADYEATRKEMIEIKRELNEEHWEAEEARQILAAKEREEALNFSFNVGEVYYIDGYNLRYVGKQGIHHCFKSVSGGWSRTYTNNQLVGKEIKPQQEKEEALKYFSKKF